MSTERNLLLDIVRIREAVVELCASRRMRDAWVRPPRRGPWTVAERLTYVVATVEQSADAWKELLSCGAPDPGPATPAESIRRRWMTATFRLPRAAAVPQALWPASGADPDDLERRIRAAALDLARVAEQVAAGPSRPPRARHRDLGPLTFDEWTRFLLVHTLHHTRRCRDAS